MKIVNLFIKIGVEVHGNITFSQILSKKYKIGKQDRPKEKRCFSHKKTAAKKQKPLNGCFCLTAALIQYLSEIVAFVQEEMTAVKFGVAAVRRGHFLPVFHIVPVEIGVAASAENV